MRKSKCVRCGNEKIKVKNGLCYCCIRKDVIYFAIKEKDNDEVLGIICKKIIDELDDNFFKGLDYNHNIVIEIVIYYLAKRKMNSPVSLNEIAYNFGYDLRERHSIRALHRIFKKIKRAIGMKTCKTSTLMGTKCLLQNNPKKYIEDICLKLNLPELVKEKSLKKLKEIEGDFIGKQPQSIAGGIVFYISRKEGLKVSKITQKDVANVLSITEVSLRSCLRRISNDKYVGYGNGKHID